MKETWKAIKNVIGRGQRRALSKQFKNQSGEMMTYSKCIADEFNDFFVNVGPNLAAKINSTGKSFYDYLKNPMNSCMFMKPIVETKIIQIITKFKQNKSAGHDDVGNLLIKRVAKEITLPLTIIFNESLKVRDEYLL